MASDFHRASFTRAFKEVYGVDGVIEDVPFHGKTDSDIAMSVLKHHGLKEDEVLTEFEEFKKVIKAVFKKIIKPDDVDVYIGVRELLSGLSRRDALLGLATGNLEEIGIEKLKAGGLDHYFRFGGFGDDCTDRVHLIRSATEKAEKEYGYKRNGEVYMIGDTPLDVIAGKKEGVKVLGVATGHYDMETLKKAGADYVLKDFSNKEEVLKVLGME